MTVKEKLSKQAGSLLMRAFYNPLWNASMSDKDTSLLVNKGLIQLKKRDKRIDEMRLGHITDLGRALVESGTVPHHPYSVPFEHRSLPDQIDLTLKILKEPGLEDDEYSIPSIEQAMRGMVNVYTPAESSPKPPPIKLLPCGSTRLKHATEKILFRALWLFQPVGLDFSDMYKSDLFTVSSKDQRYWISFELFKYEFAMYFYADSAFVEGTKHLVTTGIPGARNGTNISDPLGKSFFDLITKALNKKHEIYSGNNFSV